MGKANGTISCCISAEKGPPLVKGVIFAPDQSIKHGKSQFVAFVPDVPKGQEGRRDAEGDEMGFVRELCNGRIELDPGGFNHDLLLRAALRHTKVTVIVSQQDKPKCRPVLKALVVPAE